MTRPKVHADTAAEAIAMATEDTRYGDSTSAWWRGTDDRDLPARQLYVLRGIGQALVDINESLQALNDTLRAQSAEKPQPRNPRRPWRRSR